MVGEIWTVGERIFYIERKNNNLMFGNIVGFPKMHNAALARVKFDKLKREKVLPLDILHKDED